MEVEEIKLTPAQGVVPGGAAGSRKTVAFVEPVEDTKKKSISALLLSMFSTTR